MIYILKRQTISRIQDKEMIFLLIVQLMKINHFLNKTHKTLNQDLKLLLTNRFLLNNCFKIIFQIIIYLKNKNRDTWAKEHLKK